MSPDIVTQFVNTFGAFGLALVVFAMAAGLVWVKMMRPTLEAKNGVQAQYVNSMKEMMVNHRQEAAANLDAQVRTTEVLTELKEGLRVGNARMISDHDRILNAVDRK